MEHRVGCLSFTSLKPPKYKTWGHITNFFSVELNWKSKNSPLLLRGKTVIYWKFIPICDNIGAP